MSSHADAVLIPLAGASQHADTHVHNESPHADHAGTSSPRLSTAAGQAPTELPTSSNDVESPPSPASHRSSTPASTPVPSPTGSESASPSTQLLVGSDTIVIDASKHKTPQQTTTTQSTENTTLGATLASQPRLPASRSFGSGRSPLSYSRPLYGTRTLSPGGGLVTVGSTTLGGVHRMVDTLVRQPPSPPSGPPTSSTKTGQTTISQQAPQPPPQPQTTGSSIQQSAQDSVAVGRVSGNDNAPVDRGRLAVPASEMSGSSTSQSGNGTERQQGLSSNGFSFSGESGRGHSPARFGSGRSPRVRNLSPASSREWTTWPAEQMEEHIWKTNPVAAAAAAAESKKGRLLPQTALFMENDTAESVALSISGVLKASRANVAAQQQQQQQQHNSGTLSGSSSPPGGIKRGIPVIRRSTSRPSTDVDEPVRQSPRKRIKRDPAVLFADGVEGLTTTFGSSVSPKNKVSTLLGDSPAAADTLLKMISSSNGTSKDVGNTTTTAAGNSSNSTSANNTVKVERQTSPNVTKKTESSSKKKKRAAANAASAAARARGKRCSYCQTSTTPMWRHGPEGYPDLCNKCGVKYMRGRILNDI